MTSEGNKVRFEVPTSFTIPEGTADDGTFDVVCSMKREGGRNVCLVKIGDTEMPGYGKDKGRPGYGEYADKMRGEMAPPPPPPTEGMT